MDIGVLGINYKSSELGFREAFAKASQNFLGRNSSLPLVVLSTCNRTEIYFSSTNLAETHSELLFELKNAALESFEQMLYCYFGERCFVHLAKVTSGVDSVIFGEAEIQGQVKQAYTLAASRCKIPSSMHYLFQQSLKIGKEIRTDFCLPKGHVSLESTLWDLSQCFFSEEKRIKTLVIGHSEINRKVISYMKEKRVFDLHLATRNPKAAEEIIKKHSLIGVPWSNTKEWADFDMVICGSKCCDYILSADQIPIDPFQIKTKLIVDLGLPRNVDPILAKSPLVALFNIEEIGGFIDQKQKVSLQEQKLIQQKIEEAVAKQVNGYALKRKGVPLCV